MSPFDYCTSKKKAPTYEGRGSHEKIKIAFWTVKASLKFYNFIYLNILTI